VDYRFDRTTNKDGRVVNDVEIHALREVLFQLGHLGANVIGDLDGVGTRTLEDRDRHRRLVVQQGTQGVLAGAQLNPGNVLEAGDLAIITGADDDVLELLLSDQAALGVDRQLEAGGIGGGRGTEGTGSHLAVLLANGGHYISGCQVARGSFVWIEPYPQRVIAHAEHLHIANTVEARQLILDIEDGVVGQVEHVVALVRRGQVHNHGQVWRGFVHRDADARHFFRQFGLGAGHPVLHLHLGVVQVRAQGEGDGQGDLAVSGGLRRHIQHVLDTGDGLLQWCGHGVTDHLGVGTGEVGAHHNGRRNHFRVFADR